MRVLVAHRRDLIQEQSRRIARLRGFLLEVFPGFEATLNLNREEALVSVSKVAHPSAARRLGEARMARWLKARKARKAENFARRTIFSARVQRC